jgi:hypothetical protein
MGNRLRAFPNPENASLILIQEGIMRDKAKMEIIVLFRNLLLFIILLILLKMSGCRGEWAKEATKKEKQRKKVNFLRKLDQDDVFTLRETRNRFLASNYPQ